MERILVSMETRRGAWEAWSRAVSLAKRIEARVCALLVISPESRQAAGRDDSSADGAVRKRLELLMEQAKAEGVPIDYFVSEGDYEEEVIRFVEHNRITLMVAELTDGDARHSDREHSSIMRIRHRIKCRMEMVTPRKTREPDLMTKVSR